MTHAGSGQYIKQESDFSCPSFNVQSKHDDDSDNNDSDDDDFDDRIEYLMSLS